MTAKNNEFVIDGARLQSAFNTLTYKGMFKRLSSLPRNGLLVPIAVNATIVLADLAYSRLAPYATQKVTVRELFEIAVAGVCSTLITTAIAKAKVNPLYQANRILNASYPEDEKRVTFEIDNVRRLASKQGMLNGCITSLVTGLVYTAWLDDGMHPDRTSLASLDGVVMLGFMPILAVGIFGLANHIFKMTIRDCIGRAAAKAGAYDTPPQYIADVSAYDEMIRRLKAEWGSSANKPTLRG